MEDALEICRPRGWIRAYARYRKAVAMDRLVASSDSGGRSRAAKWALAWGVAAQFWPAEDELGPAPLRRVSLNIHTRKLGADLPLGVDGSHGDRPTAGGSAAIEDQLPALTQAGRGPVAGDRAETDERARHRGSY